MRILRARSAPTTDPTPRPAGITQSRPTPWLQSSSVRVAITATSIPTEPIRFARTAVRGWASPLKVRMKSTEARR